jgi:hypothetical protein
MIHLLGWTGNTPIANAILQGTAVLPQDLDPSILELITFLSTPISLNKFGPMEVSISAEEYVYSWKRTKEYTSSGQSGLHFGHFKASCRDQQLVEIDRQLLEIPFHARFVPNRWKSGIDCMIPKKVDSLQVDQLRTILLFEADCNHLFKIFGRRMMALAEQAQTISPEQYGSRKKKSSILHATNKQITFDIIRQKKMNAALLVLDAKSCYDRISSPIASLALKRQGAPQ